MTEIEKQFEGFDRVFPLIGGHHLYQWLLLGLVAFQRGLIVFPHISYIFLGASPDHWCHVKELDNSSWSPAQIKNLSVPLGEECEYYDLDYAQILHRTPRYEDALASVDYTGVGRKECDGWEYDTTIYRSTTVTEFNLVCHRKHLVATIQATYMAGVFIGSLFLGSISDKILGRKQTSFLCFGIVIVFGFVTSFASSYTMFVVCRFITAIGVAGASQNCYTILMEYSDTSCRAMMGMMTEVAFGLFYMLVPLYAYFIRDWADLQLAFAFSTLTLLAHFFFLPESSRWLAQNGREEEALDILEGIAKRNRQPPPSRQELKTILVESCQPLPEGERTNKGVKAGIRSFLSSYASLVRTPELRRRSCLVWFLYLTIAFCYYGVSFGSPSLTSDPFLIVFLGGLVEIPAYLGSIPLVSLWGRKPTAVTTFLLGGLSYLAIVFVPYDLKELRVTLAMMSKLFVSAGTAIVILLAAELYPTEDRSTGFGLAVVFGRIGSIIAPYVVRAKFSYAEMSVIIIGVTAILSAAVGLMLPETKDEEMFEKVVNIENVVARRRSTINPTAITAMHALNQHAVVDADTTISPEKADETVKNGETSA